eukprot:GHVR01175357.1.p1 GENE.GHVR01175357.1~~GHVR01175357.1.p1  ORF type:complete len:748 (+),score=136.20 GHVR01175357.1:64-2307(+)
MDKSSRGSSPHDVTASHTLHDNNEYKSDKVMTSSCIDESTSNDINKTTNDINKTTNDINKTTNDINKTTNDINKTTNITTNKTTNITTYITPDISPHTTRLMTPQGSPLISRLKGVHLPPQGSPHTTRLMTPQGSPLISTHVSPHRSTKASRVSPSKTSYISPSRTKRSRRSIERRSMDRRTQYTSECTTRLNRHSPDSYRTSDKRQYSPDNRHYSPDRRRQYPPVSHQSTGSRRTNTRSPHRHSYRHSPHRHTRRDETVYSLDRRTKYYNDKDKCDISPPVPSRSRSREKKEVSRDRHQQKKEVSRDRHQQRDGEGGVDGMGEKDREKERKKERETDTDKERERVESCDSKGESIIESKRERMTSTKITIKEQEVSFIDGRTKNKIAIVSKADIVLDRLSLLISGTETAVEKAKTYCELMLAQRTGAVALPFTPRDDLTLLPVPRKCVAYVTGREGTMLQCMEDEFTTLVFFTEPRHSKSNADTDNLAIFGSLRGRMGCQLKVMSAVEHKIPGHYTNGLRDKVCTEPGFSTDMKAVLDEQEFSYILGKKGNTKRKIAKASGCVLEYIGKFAFMSGTYEERQRCRDYLDWLMKQRVGIVKVENMNSRNDLEIVRIPRDCAAYITGTQGMALREVEDKSKTFCFIDGNKTHNEELLLIFSWSLSARMKAKDLIEHRMFEKKSGRTSGRFEVYSMNHHRKEDLESKNLRGSPRYSPIHTRKRSPSYTPMRRRRRSCSESESGRKNIRNR